jgi:hypothetical protein
LFVELRAARNERSVRIETQHWRLEVTGAKGVEDAVAQGSDFA